MSEFKFACPVCGQHITADSKDTGSEISCPTCYRKIIVPQAPTLGDPKFVLSASEANKPRPTGAAARPEAIQAKPQKTALPLALVVAMILICAIGAGLFAFRDRIFKSATAPVEPTNSQQVHPEQTSVSPPPAPLPFVAIVPTNLPPPSGTNFWTLKIDTIGTPDLPATGKVHGRYFTAKRMVLNHDGLTLRTPDLPPEAGVTIYLKPNPIESVFGKAIVIEPGAVNAPAVFLRWKDNQGREMTKAETTGYALRIEFGLPENNNLPGKIYLCTADEMKSYVVGKFNAEIVRP